MSDVNSTGRDGSGDRRRWLILGVIALAQLMVVLEVSATVFNCATSIIPGCVVAGQQA